MHPKHKSPRTIPPYRISRHHTVVVPKVSGPAIQEAVLGVFKQNKFESIDLEALIHCTLLHFETTLESYAPMYAAVRKHVFSHFAMEQGDLIPPVERSVRRTMVCYTIETDQE